MILLLSCHPVSSSLNLNLDAKATAVSWASNTMWWRGETQSSSPHSSAWEGLLDLVDSLFPFAYPISSPYDKSLFILPWLPVRVLLHTFTCPHGLPRLPFVVFHPSHPYYVPGYMHYLLPFLFTRTCESCLLHHFPTHCISHVAPYNPCRTLFRLLPTLLLISLEETLKNGTFWYLENS